MSSKPINAERLADIHEIRRRNLRLLIDEYAGGNLTHFVEVTLKGSLSYKGLQRVTTLTAGPRKRRNLGYMLARRIEVQLKLPRAWMDLERSGVVQAWPIPNGRSERVMRLAESIASLSPPMRVPIEQIVEALKEVSKRKGAAA
jgi:hypothetical protein